MDNYNHKLSPALRRQYLYLCKVHTSGTGKTPLKGVIAEIMGVPLSTLTKATANMGKL